MLNVLRILPFMRSFSLSYISAGFSGLSEARRETARFFAIFPLSGRFRRQKSGFKNTFLKKIKEIFRKKAEP